MREVAGKATPIDVLLVEDDEAIRETLCEVLQEEGYIVATASHGGHALNKLQKGLRPQLILLDLMMPVMDGWQLLQHLHGAAELQHIPVIVVSAARDALPQGARRYLNKPVDLDTLLEAVGHHLHGSPGRDGSATGPHVAGVGAMQLSAGR